MKRHLLLTMLLALLTAGGATAAPFGFYKPVAWISPNNVYSFYIDGDNLNGTFDTIFFQAKAWRGTFTNTNSGAVAGIPRPAGDFFTYPNRMLTADPVDFPGGLALTQVGLVNNAQELSFTAGKLGGTVTTAAEVDGNLFLGNVMTSTGVGFDWRIQLISAGNVLYDTSGTIPFPEPASFSIAAFSFVGLVAVRRRCLTAAR